MSTAKPVYVTIASIEVDLRDDLTALYATYVEKLKEFIVRRLKQLQTGATISASDFAREVKAISDQVLAENDSMFEANAFSEDDFSRWTCEAGAPLEKVRNGVLITIFEVYLDVLEKDSERESSRLLGMSQLLSVLAS